MQIMQLSMLVRSPPPLLLSSQHPPTTSLTTRNRFSSFQTNVPARAVKRQIRCYLDNPGDFKEPMNAATRDGEKAMPVQDAQASTSRTLYPPLGSHKKAHLQVSSLHTIYYEVFGNPKGRPVVFLHGGPGAGCSDRHARFFDPQHYRIVLFDQRGCGKSSPRGCLVENTTWDLVADIEQLRLHLGVIKWMVMGGSWGVTLALTYAQSHPDAVAALILRGVCLLRPQEIDWFYKRGANALYPFGWEELLSLLEPTERDNVLSAYYERLTSTDIPTQQRAAQAWLRWEMGLSFFSTSPFVIEWDGQQYHTSPSPLVSSGKTREESQSNSEEAQRRPSGSSPPSSSPSSSSTATGAPSSSSSSLSSSSASSSQKGKSSNNMSQGSGAYMSSQVAQARLESHYFSPSSPEFSPSQVERLLSCLGSGQVNGGFLDDDQLLQGIPKMRHIPGVIVQGRYDFVCPLSNAFDLHRAWPEARLRIVPNAGHSMYEQGILHELVHATDLFKQLEY